MRIKALIGLLLLMLYPGSVLAQSGETDQSSARRLFVTLAPGYSSVRVGADYTADGRATREDSIPIKLALEYEFAEQLRVGIGRYAYVDVIIEFLWEDEFFQLEEYFLSLGYSFALDSIRLVPYLGYSFYELSATETEFLGFSESRSVLKDEDFFAGLRLEWHVAENVAVLLEWRQLQTDFGEVDTRLWGFHLMF